MNHPCLLFDLDGTLTNADHFHHAAFNALLAQHDRTLSIEEYGDLVMGRANDVIFAGLFPDLPAGAHRDLAEVKETHYRALATKLDPLPGLVGLLDFATRAGWRRAVVTNGPMINASHSLAAMNIGGAFEAVVSGVELPFAKPHPLPYQTSLWQLEGDAAHSAGFEDSLSGLEAGLAAGLMMVGITTGLPADILLKHGATIAIADYTDRRLLPLLKKRLGAAAAGKA